jgi:hypothetical protein
LVNVMSLLILKRAPIGDNQEDYSVLENGVLVGRIFATLSAPEGRVDVDDRLRPPQRSHAHPRLRGDAPGADGGIREELAGGSASGRPTLLVATRARFVEFSNIAATFAHALAACLTVSISSGGHPARDFVA